MKFLSSAMLALLLVVSGQSVAEQTAQPTTQTNRDVMIIPTAHDQSLSISIIGGLAAISPTS